jgi:formyl-CoA transferase
VTSSNATRARRGTGGRKSSGELGPVTYDGVLPRLSATPGSVRTAGPLIGQDTHAVLRDVLGMSDEEIAETEAMGVLM